MTNNNNNNVFHYLINTEENNVQNIIDNAFLMICTNFNLYCGIITRINNLNDNTIHIKKRAVPHWVQPFKYSNLSPLTPSREGKEKLNYISGTISSATILITLIIGLIAGPAVSL